MILKGKISPAALTPALINQPNEILPALPAGTDALIIQANLRRSEIRFRRLFETTQDGILILDPVTRKITDANPFIVNLLGYSRQQLIKKELWQIGLLKDEAASQEAFRFLQTKGFIRYDDLPLKTKGGRHHEVEFISNLYDEDGEAVIQCNIRDITERKQAEAALREARILLAGHTQQLEVQVARRTGQLTASNQRLENALSAVQKGKAQYEKLFLEALVMEKKSRRLARQILSAQEDERRAISRELHDEVVQTLVGINVELAALGTAAQSGNRLLRVKISHTQRLVEKSVNAVHRFARELRPAVLDDLGLIPALHAYCKNLAAQTKLRINITAFGGVEAFDNPRKTVLFRVAQESLTNVVRHAQATEVNLRITAIPGGVCMEVQDDGKSFEVLKTLASKTNKRLGLLGMRERVEMVGGTLTIESAPNHGTTVRASIFTPAGKKKS